MGTQPSHDPLLATVADVLREALGGLDGIRAAFVFGSMVRGDTRPDSDVDVLVVDEEVSREVMGGALLEAESLLGREVGVKRYTPDALARKADLLLAAPPLHLRLALDGGPDIPRHFEVDEPIHVVAAGEPGEQPVLVLVDTPDEVVGDADVERAGKADEDVDVVLPHRMTATR